MAIEQIDRLLEEVMHPSEEFTPMPFWFFNDRPDESRIRMQLEDYVQKGVNGLVLHPRIGIPKEVPYLSVEYFKWIKYIVKTASELGMRIVLYDEGMYPSGSAHGMVVAANPDYASKGIALKTLPLQDDRILAKLDEEKMLVYGFTKGTIRGIHFGEDDGEAGAPASADILNPDAVDCFIHLTHDRYYEECKEYFGNTIIGFFTDEPCSLGRNAGYYREWVYGMESELAAEGGKLEELQGLFTGEENHTTKIYHKLIKKYYRNIFYSRLSNWCENHGIALMGHPAKSDDVEEELYFHVPGQDLVFRWVKPWNGGLDEFDSVQAKLPADIARHLGRRRNSSECFGVCNRKYPEIDNPSHEELRAAERFDGKMVDWYLPFKDLKWYINWLGIRGVNMFIPHAFYYSVDGQRKGERPPDVGPNNIWWPYYRQVSDYIKRICYLQTDSLDGSKVAVLCDNNRVPYAQIASLYENQIEFDYLPQVMIEKHCQYDVVLNLLGDEFDERVHNSSSNTVIFHSAEEVVKYADSESGKAIRLVKVEHYCPQLRTVSLNKKDVSMVMCANEGSQEISAKILLGDCRRIGIVDLWKGAWYSHAGNEQELTLEPGEMQLLILDYDGDMELRDNKNEIFLGDWTEKLQVTETAENSIMYSLCCDVDKVCGDEFFAVRGEEMAECWCNGKFAGGSLMSPHSFDIGHLLKTGINEVKVKFTGSAANVYENAEIPFGAGIDNGR